MVDKNTALSVLEVEGALRAGKTLRSIADMVTGLDRNDTARVALATMFKLTVDDAVKVISLFAADADCINQLQDSLDAVAS